MAVVRNELGRVVKGSALNPGGRPKLPAELREVAQAACPQAIQTVIALLDHRDPKIQLRAAEILLDRGYGRPVQALEAKVESVDHSRAHLEALKRLAHRERREPV
jgi:hypothetical protein